MDNKEHPMRSIPRMIGSIAVMLLTVLPALAQEAEAAPEPPQGMHLLMLILGLGAVGLIGILMYRRETSGSDDELV